MRGTVRIGIATFAFLSAASVPAYAGLINPTSTVDISFDFVDPTLGSISAPSQVFNTGQPGPFSLSAPIIPPGTPIHTTEPFNLSANAGFWFTNNQVTIYNNASPPVPFCFSSSNTGSSCADPYNTFDFKFTNENIVKVSVDPGSSADFLPATFGSHTGLTLVSPNEFTVDVTGENPAFLSTLIIDVTTFSSPAPSAGVGLLQCLGVLGFIAFAVRRRGLRA